MPPAQDELHMLPVAGAAVPAVAVWAKTPAAAVTKAAARLGLPKSQCRVKETGLYRTAATSRTRYVVRPR